MKKEEFFGKVIKNNDLIKKVNDIHIDSRKVRENDIFIAIRKGNQYVEEVLSKGATLAFYDDKKIKINNERAIYVKDSVEFLQKIAHEYRKKLDVKVIGITGSEGKTSTKDIVYSILSTQYKGKKTQGNYNNHLGLPLTLLQLEEDDKFIALEMGMSNLGEIDLLSKIAEPDYAVITNIGDSHLEFLKNRENVFKAKTEILEYVEPKNRILFGDDIFFKGIEGVKVGKGKNNDYQILNFNQDENGSSFEISIKNKEKNKKIQIESKLFGEYNSVNVTLALAISRKFEITVKNIKLACKNLELTKQRFEKLDYNGKTFINDAYNASPVAMEVAIKTFDSVYKNSYKVLVLGDMLELGENSQKYHEGLEKVLMDVEFEELYLVGKEIKCLFDKVKKTLKLENKTCEYYENIELAKSRITEIKDEAYVFLKASNGISLNKIFN